MRKSMAYYYYIRGQRDKHEGEAQSGARGQVATWTERPINGLQLEHQGTHHT